MDIISIHEAFKNQEYNLKRSKDYPESEKEFHDEYMYSNPNDFQEMKELYSYFGYQYSRSLWAMQQVAYNEADKANKKRNKK